MLEIVDDKTYSDELSEEMLLMLILHTDRAISVEKE